MYGVSMNYLAFPLKQLLENYQSPCDLYLNLSDEKYVKFINANDFYDEEVVLKYIFKKIMNFYINENDLDDFNAHFNDTLKINLEHTSPSDFSPEKNLAKAFEKVRDFAHKVDIAEETIEFVELIQKQSIKLIRKEKNDVYNLIFERLSHNNYLSDHSLMTSMICCSVAIKMSWSTKATLEKFVLAALFHDLTLTEDQHAKPRYDAEIDNGVLSSKDIEIIKSHPQEAVKLFLKTNISSPNVDQIILSHHELPDGSGFPRNLDAFKTPPYICLFILCEEFVSTMIKHEFSDKAWTELQYKFENFFNSGNYRKPIQAFKQAFKRLS